MAARGRGAKRIRAERIHTRRDMRARTSNRSGHGVHSKIVSRMRTAPATTAAAAGSVHRVSVAWAGRSARAHAIVGLATPPQKPALPAPRSHHLLPARACPRMPRRKRAATSMSSPLPREMGCVWPGGATLWSQPAFPRNGPCDGNNCNPPSVRLTRRPPRPN